MVKISVCIATWCRKTMLCEIIRLLENQSIQHDDYEIIVVDSNSPDGTYEAVEELCRQFDNLRYIPDAKNILAVKRNVGIQQARSDIVVFMDDDVYPDYKFIEAHLNANLYNDRIFYCGQIRFPEEKCKISNYYHFRDQQHLKSDKIGVDLPFNNVVVMNLSFRKEYIKDVGYVDERFLGYGGEDIEFGYRIVKNGYALRYLPDAIGIHMEESAGIVEYGKKMYKSGLHGGRALRKICPEASKSIAGKRKIAGYILSLSLINLSLEKYLSFTDTNRRLYSYLIYKMYCYGKSYRGRRDQNKIRELNMEDISKGW